MTVELPSQYQPQDIEKKILDFWIGENHFHAEPESAGDSYCIVIPPPNVTAALHMGHALNNTIQDILIRYHRMLGDNTVWIPGTDHAGIATQTVVEKRVLKEEGKRRTDFKRDEFVAKIQAWKDEYEARILTQLKTMGCSCDWDRTRFTMDDVCAKAVREAFFQLFKDGLIYRGKRLVNWDPATQTALADDEVEMHEIDGHFWYLKYPLVEPVEIGGQILETITVATTRPETMLGDTAVAMNPKDPRAAALVGKQIRLPIVNRIIPIIADDYVVLPDAESEDAKAKFATGFLKVTPAHDPNDYEIGQRHQLPVINVMAPDATISDQFGWQDVGGAEEVGLLGLDRYEAREAIVDWFRENKLLEEVKPYRHSVGHSYRSHVPIEPYLSDQWYVKVTDDRMSGAALRAMAQFDSSNAPLMNPLPHGRGSLNSDHSLRFYPERYAKTFQNWHENIRDWCISRQLWWGHRIPVWRRATKLETPPDNLADIVEKLLAWQSEGRLHTQYRGEHVPIEKIEREQIDLTVFFICVRNPEDFEVTEYLKSFGLEQDPDVLDTWFSSALWPFSTLGWPEDNKELKTWNPGSVLCTAREIITLWVSRMVMMNLYLLNRLPFKDVYIHAMLQDGQGRKMSKSLGNGVDPLDIIEKYGSDAMRFSLAYLTTGMQDIRMPVKRETLPDGRQINTSERFEIGRNFSNKIWNAARFVMMNLQNATPAKPLDVSKLPREDRWIISRLQQTVKEVTGNLNAYEFSETSSVLYRFFWNEFCDWYLELVKSRLQEQSESADQARQVLAFVLDQILRLLHPMMPFITEALWSYLNEICPKRGLAEIFESKTPVVKSSWPMFAQAHIDESAENEMSDLQTLIRELRDVRTNVNRIRSANKEKSVNTLPKAIVRCRDDASDLWREAQSMIRECGYIDEISVESDCSVPQGSSVKVITDRLGRAIDLIIPLAELIDLEQERMRIEKEIGELKNHVARSEERLSNQNFVSKAPAKVLDEHRQKLAELKAKHDSLAATLAELK